MSKFNIKDELKRDMIDKIKTYFSNELEDEIGDLKAMLILDFITEELASSFYNMGIEDASNYIKEKIDDIYILEKY